MAGRRGPGQPAWGRAVQAVLLLAACIAALALRSIWRLRSGQRSQQWPERCSSWAAAHRLAGGCVAVLDEGTAAFSCCTNGSAGTGCPTCSPPIFSALECTAPRHMLLHPQPGCAAQVVPPPRLPPPQSLQQPCSLTAGAVEKGRWALSPGDLPAAPRHSFQPTASCRQRPLGAAEVPACLWAAGFDRVLVSGDSTVRQLYTRLIG